MFRVLIIASLLMASACTSTDPNPSQALRIANAMGVPAKDIERKEWEKIVVKEGYSAEAVARGEFVMSSLQSWTSGSPTALLTSGLGPKKIESSIHIVAWVPEDQANSPEEAKDLAALLLQKARSTISTSSNENNTDALNRKVKYIMTIPYGESGPFHGIEQIKQLATGGTPTLSPPPTFINSEKRQYGPIFLDLNGGVSSRDKIEEITKLSSALPDWFYIYNPGIKGISPNTIINRGYHQLFIKPENPNRD